MTDVAAPPRGSILSTIADRMSVVTVTLKKELMSYFFSPVGPIVAVLFYLFRGFEISSQIEHIAMWGLSQDDFAMAYTLQLSSFVMIILVPPLLTMRVFAEEKRTGSLEVLMTAPVREWQIVVGKWLAALVFFAILWGPTLIILWVLTGSGFLATDLAYSPVLSGYLGLALVGSLLLAFGCFTSSLTDNQLLASLAAMLFNLMFLKGVGWLSPHVTELASEHYWIRALMEQLSVEQHLGMWFARGLIDTSQVVFYVGGTAFLLFLTTKSLEARRWR